MKMKKMTEPALCSLALGGFLVIASAPASPAMAAGLSCLQERDAQGTCGDAQGNGSCECSFGALPWGETTSTTWCRTSGKPQPACRRPAPADEQPEAQLPEAEAMARALESRNPYVATLVHTLQEGRRWVDGPVNGILHDSDYDPTTGELSHSPALRFSGHVIQNGLGAAGIEITVAGDLGRLVHLKSQAGSAVPPRTIQGTVTGGGLHGSLQVLGVDGRSETIQW
ncbi:MAG TPA: hypothetical protein VFR31_08415 [Thermoanaerobaculia bacterium]|nr:hypothetical protein [Thermoanaerobaculia bacterium]